MFGVNWFKKKNKTPESPEMKDLKQRLEVIKGRRVVDFNVGIFGDVTIQFEDKIILEFISWDGFFKRPDFDGIEVKEIE